MKGVVLTLVLSALFLTGFSQNNGRKITIKGTVLDGSGAPVKNAIVMIDGRETRSVTDENGRYSVRVPKSSESIGIFTFGNGMMGELIGGRTDIDFRFTIPVLNPGISNPGDDAVNTGYSSVKKKDLTTQVSRVDGTRKNYSSYSSVLEMIQRECSGVRISNGSVIIQDSKNMMGSVPALYVVDGTYVNSIDDIPPSSVETIEVLKGTSASIYGSRGYGGAVVITTKKKN